MAGCHASAGKRHQHAGVRLPPLPISRRAGARAIRRRCRELGGLVRFRFPWTRCQRIEVISNKEGLDQRCATIQMSYPLGRSADSQARRLCCFHCAFGVADSPAAAAPRPAVAGPRGPPMLPMPGRGAGLAGRRSPEPRRPAAHSPIEAVIIRAPRSAAATPMLAVIGGARGRSTRNGGFPGPPPPLF